MKNILKVLLTAIFLFGSAPIYSMDTNSESEMSIKKKKKKGKKLKGKASKGKKGGWGKWKSKWKKEKSE